MSTSSSIRVCAECGSALPVSAPEGLCPRCLFAGPSQDSAALDQTQAATLPSGAPAGITQGQSAKLNSPTFGDYQLLEEIARGGMGVVYKARQISLNRSVAVKMILAGEFAGKEVTRRFQGEASAAAVLQHPNIVAVHEVGVHQLHHFFSMDYVQGQNLAQLVGSRPLAPAQAARYVRIIAQAIHYAHGQGILHRDLKPSNVLVDAATDEPRVTDFGLARRLEGESSLTVSGQVLGSPHFMPPEQASGSRGKVGRQSDVFGLGAILYYLLTARAPFQGENLETIIEQVLHVEPVSPRLLNPAVSLDLETICLKCLEKEPARRYGTEEELAEELDRVLKDQPIHARPVGRVEKGWRWCRRHPTVASLSVLSLALLIVMMIGAPLALLQINRARDYAEQSLYAADMNLAFKAQEANNRGQVLRLLEAHRPSAPRTRKRAGWEWYYLSDQTRSDEIVTLAHSEHEMIGVAFSPGAQHLAASDGNRVIIWDISLLKPITSAEALSTGVPLSMLSLSRKTSNSS